MNAARRVLCDSDAFCEMVTDRPKFSEWLKSFHPPNIDTDDDDDDDDEISEASVPPCVLTRAEVEYLLTPPVVEFFADVLRVAPSQLLEVEFAALEDFAESTVNETTLTTSIASKRIKLEFGFDLTRLLYGGGGEGGRRTTKTPRRLVDAFRVLLLMNTTGTPLSVSMENVLYLAPRLNDSGYWTDLMYVARLLYRTPEIVSLVEILTPVGRRRLPKFLRRIGIAEFLARLNPSRIHLRFWERVVTELGDHSAVDLETLISAHEFPFDDYQFPARSLARDAWRVWLYHAARRETKDFMGCANFFMRWRTIIAQLTGISEVFMLEYLVDVKYRNDPTATTESQIMDDIHCRRERARTLFREFSEDDVDDDAENEEVEMVEEVKEEEVVVKEREETSAGRTVASTRSAFRPYVSSSSHHHDPTTNPMLRPLKVKKKVKTTTETNDEETKKKKKNKKKKKKKVEESTMTTSRVEEGGETDVKLEKKASEPPVVRLPHVETCEACRTDEPCDDRRCNRTHRNSTSFACRPGEYRLCKRHHNVLFYTVNRGGALLVLHRSGKVMYTVSLNDAVFTVGAIPFDTLGPAVQTPYAPMSGTPSASLRLWVTHHPDGTVTRKIHTARHRIGGGELHHEDGVTTTTTNGRDLEVPAEEGFRLAIRSEMRSVPTGINVLIGVVVLDDDDDARQTERIEFPLGTKERPGRIRFNDRDTERVSTSIRISECFRVPENRQLDEHFINPTVNVTEFVQRAMNCTSPLLSGASGAEEEEEKYNIPKQSMKGKTPDFYVVSFGTNRDVVKRQYQSIRFESVCESNGV